MPEWLGGWKGVFKRGKLGEGVRDSGKGDNLIDVDMVRGDRGESIFPECGSGGRLVRFPIL